MVRRDAVVEGTDVTLRTVDPVGVLQALTSWALAETVAVEALTVERADLEDAYLDLIERTTS